MHGRINTSSDIVEILHVVFREVSARRLDVAKTGGNDFIDFCEACASSGMLCIKRGFQRIMRYGQKTSVSDSPNQHNQSHNEILNVPVGLSTQYLLVA